MDSSEDVHNTEEGKVEFVGMQVMARMPVKQEEYHNTSSTYVNAIVTIARRRAVAELSFTDINYTDPEIESNEKVVPLVIDIPLNFNTTSQDERDIIESSTGKHSPKPTLPVGRNSFLVVDIAKANSTSKIFENSSATDLINNIHRALSVQRAKQDALFTMAHDLTNSFEIQAAFILHRKNPLNEDDGMRLFALLDSTGRGKITMEEILHETGRSATSEAHDLIWRYCDTPLAHLRNKQALAMLFGNIHTQPDGSIGVNEWRDFLALLMLHDHNFLRQKGLATGRAYFGKGHSTPCEDLVGQTDASKEVLGCLDPGWVADFCYYQCNHHPLLGLFLSDADNPLTRLDRLKIEFAVNSWNLFASTIVFHISQTQALVYLISFAMVTVPVMIIRTILLSLFTCPCLHIRNSHPRACQRKCFSCCRSAGHSLGTLYVLGGCAFLVLGILSAIRAGSGFVKGWIFSWGLSYVLCVCVDLCLKFNTIRACVYFRQSWLSLVCLGAVQHSRLSQWQLEKNIVLSTMSGECASPSRGTSIRSDNSSDKFRMSRKWSYQYQGYKQAQVLPV